MVAPAPVGIAAVPGEGGPVAADDGQQMRALVHQLAEYQLRAFIVPAGVPLGEVLVG
jgi:hypothetical protein